MKLSISRRNNARCMYRYFLHYVCGLRPVEVSTALTFGSAWHRLQELQDTDAVREELVEEDRLSEYDIVKFLVAWRGYQANWTDETPWEVVGSEVPFELPLQYDGHVLAGIIDKIIVRDDKLWALEFKTTSRDISAGGDYWSRLRVDGQCSAYICALHYLQKQGEIPNKEVSGILYDVTKVPKIRPKKLTKKQKKEYPDVDVETPEMFGTRFADMVKSDPDAYFRRQPVFRTRDELKNFYLDISGEACKIAYMCEREIYPRDTGLCNFPYKCPYQRPCWQNAEIGDQPPEGFKFEETE